MPIYPRGSSFMVSIGSGKDRVRSTWPTMEQAEAAERDILAKRQADALAVQLSAQRGDTTKTLQEAYERTYREVWKGTKGERTTVMNAKAMVALLGADTPVTAINSETLAEAMDELEDLGNTGATINKKMSTVNVMLKGAKARGWLKFVPDVQRRREASQRIYWYTEEEERAMLDAAHRLGLPELADFITFAIDTGFRRSELLRLRVDQYHEGVVRLHAGETKNGDGRSVPATDPVKAIIERAKKAGKTRVFDGLTEAILRSQWSHLRESLGKAEDPKYIVHVLRHTTATRLAIAGASAPQIMAYMGHRAIQTSMRYIHLTTNHLTGVAALLTRTVPAAPSLRVVNGGL